MVNKARHQHLTTSAMRAVMLVLLASFVVASDGGKGGGGKKMMKKGMKSMKGMKGMSKAGMKGILGGDIKKKKKKKSYPIAPTTKTPPPSPMLTLQPTLDPPTVVPSVAPAGTSTTSVTSTMTSSSSSLREPTTPFDLLDPDTCFFQGLTFPDVVNQCVFFNNVTIVPADVEMLFNTLAEIVEEASPPPSTCNMTESGSQSVAEAIKSHQGSTWLLNCDINCSLLVQALTGNTSLTHFESQLGRDILSRMAAVRLCPFASSQPVDCEFRRIVCL